MKQQVSDIWNKLRNSSFFRDSCWAVFGNGLGMGLLLIASIIIARYLGRDLYGEYGVVKTNMFYIASFSTFGLGLTSTRFIAIYLKEKSTQVIGIINTSLLITLIFSSFLAIILAIFSQSLSNYLNAPSMKEPFRILSFIIVVKAVCMTTNGVLAGLGDFKSIAKNSVYSGIIMLASCAPMSIYWGLKGSLAALCISQIVNTGLNIFIIQRRKKGLPNCDKSFSAKTLVCFSFPVAMQEISYSVCNWIGLLLLTKFSTFGEVGIYTATAQWNAVILFLPGLLSNVVLSHLSGTIDTAAHRSKINKMLLVYLMCTLVPFLIVYIFTPFIVSFYGPQFSQMGAVLRVLTLAVIPLCCSDVFKSELLASGHPWLLFSIRLIKDVLFLCIVAFLLINYIEYGGAMIYAISSLFISILFFIALFLCYKIQNNVHE